MRELVNEWRRAYPNTPERLFEVFEKVDRASFLPPNKAHLAEVDAPIPIGYGQTTSQPTTIFIMLRLLSPEPGDKVLEIGTGCGYQTALLAELVGSSGKVVSVERIPELHELAAKNLQNYKNVHLLLGDGSKGHPQESPYDAIIVSASTPMPVALQLAAQLKEKGGRLVAPISTNAYEEMTLFVKRGKRLEKRTYGPFSFVPLIVEE